MMKQKKSKTKNTGLQIPKLVSFVPMPPIKPAKEDTHPRYIDAEPIEKFITDGLNSQENPYGWVGVKILAEVHYAPSADVEPVVHAHNSGTDYADCDQFVCSKCGIELQGWSRIERDPDDGEEHLCEYIIKRCPECGAKIDEER